jgi:hypothetical protein
MTGRFCSGSDLRRDAPPELLPFLNAVAHLLVEDYLRRESEKAGHPLVPTRNLAETAKRRNILDMAVEFTGMKRVLTAGSSEKIPGKLYDLTARLETITTAGKYEAEHKAFCGWFCRKISTAEKKLRNGNQKIDHAVARWNPNVNVGE